MGLFPDDPIGLWAKPNWLCRYIRKHRMEWRGNKIYNQRVILQCKIHELSNKWSSWLKGNTIESILFPFSVSVCPSFMAQIHIFLFLFFRFDDSILSNGHCETISMDKAFRRTKTMIDDTLNAKLKHQLSGVVELRVCFSFGIEIET